ncbi:thimet oligopeptidase-like [Uloborus diversus]|uniref:thimet oligopeptidase-like n=1 Tax=Uloborus diversus TaxID=327109 RepID=UPI002409F1A0|nr:thimet oligopeptidase-like [Uloborus diversus]
MLPPGFRHNWNLKISANDILIEADKLINNSREILDKIGSVSDESVSYHTLLKELADFDCEYNSNIGLLTLLRHVSTDQAVRDASTEAEAKFEAFDIEIEMRQDIFNKLLILQKKQEDMKPEAKRYLEKLIQRGERGGLHLPEETQKQVKDLKTRLTELGIQFQKNLNEETTVLEFTEEELDGLTQDFLSGLQKNEKSGKFEVTLKYPHAFPVLRKCRNENTRHRMHVAFNSRCMNENKHILEELVKLRKQHALLLGFPSHPAYIMDILMAKTPETVHSFLTELWHDLTPLWEKERAYMLELKEAECKEMNKIFDGKLNEWDVKYYITKVEEKKYAVDNEKLKEYFPLPVVTEGLLNIYQELLSLKFKEIENAEVWHEDVKLYSVHDSEHQTLLGYFYLDLFPRPGKYGHAAVCSIQPTCLLADGSRQISICAMVANFTKPLADKPSLLDHQEVVTFFHEFGHVMHNICKRQEFAYFSRVERDFIEAPSQMLENWCWEVESLKRMSAHYSDKSEIPHDIIHLLVNSKLANVGYLNLRQVVLAMYDLKIHSEPESDLRQMFYAINRDVLNIEVPSETFMPSAFGHLAGGYDARYYGYLWSEVYSMDMFDTVFKNGNLFNAEAGMKYRNSILKPGGTKDAYDMLVDFLGREPSRDAFLRSKGLTKKESN